MPRPAADDSMHRQAQVGGNLLVPLAQKPYSSRRLGWSFSGNPAWVAPKGRVYQSGPLPLKAPVPGARQTG
jgi:hypothetical protein